jgi:uncharacterized protein
MAGTVSDSRRTEVADLLTAVTDWARGRPDLHALGLAGSWARDAARMDSDVDLVLLTDEIPRYLGEPPDPLVAVGGGPVIHTARWGVLTERRVRRPSGLEVEFGIVAPTWAGCSPVDPGTRRVVRDGLRPLHDPHGLLARLVRAVARDG